MRAATDLQPGPALRNCNIAGDDVNVENGGSAGYVVAVLENKKGLMIGTVLAPSGSGAIALPPTGQILGDPVAGVTCRQASNSEITDSRNGASTCPDIHDVHSDNGLEPRLASLLLTGMGTFVSVGVDEVSMFKGRTAHPVSALVSVEADGVSRGAFVTGKAGEPAVLFLQGPGPHELILRAVNYVTGVAQVENEREYCLGVIEK